MNSKSRRSLALMAVLLGLPAQAQITKPGTEPAPPKPAAPATQARVEAALESVRQRVLAGDNDRAAYDEAVGAIRSSFENLQASTPDTQSVRSRLVAALDDIYARAKQGQIAAEEFAALRVEVLDASLQDALARLATQSGSGGLKAVESALKQLADAARELDPGTAGWQSRAQALLDELKQKPAAGAAEIEPLQSELAHARALRAEVLLEKHATQKSATATDFARMRNHVSDMLELQARLDPQARELQQKLAAAIDELEQRAAQSQLTRADFESLRKELAQRGRTALAEKHKPKG
jgi:chromosome segregation ATPase